MRREQVSPNVIRAPTAVPAEACAVGVRWTAWACAPWWLRVSISCPYVREEGKPKLRLCPGARHVKCAPLRLQRAWGNRVRGQEGTARSPQTVVVGGKPEERPGGRDPGAIRTPQLTTACKRRATAHAGVSARAAVPCGPRLTRSVRPRKRHGRQYRRKSIRECDILLSQADKVSTATKGYDCGPSHNAHVGRQRSLRRSGTGFAGRKRLLQRGSRERRATSGAYNASPPRKRTAISLLERKERRWDSTQVLPMHSVKGW